jgi:hypothetical protein
MSELKIYVEKLFKRFKNENYSDLKEEILSNLVDKKNDLIKSGLSEFEAIEKAKNSIKNIDHLIDENIIVEINKIKKEALQYSLIYLLSAWIISIPSIIFNTGFFLRILLFFSILITGLWYCFCLMKKNPDYVLKRKSINYLKIKKAKNIFWFIWLLFFLTAFSTLTAVQFASNIWFSNPIIINGPYNLGLIVFRYLIISLTLVFPLIFQKSFNLLKNYEVKNYEN